LWGQPKDVSQLDVRSFTMLRLFLPEKRNEDTIRMLRIAWMQIELKFKFQQKNTISLVVFTFSVIGLTMLEFLNSLADTRCTILIFSSQKKGDGYLAIDRMSLDSTL